MPAHILRRWPEAARHWQPPSGRTLGLVALVAAVVWAHQQTVTAVATWLTRPTASARVDVNARPVAVRWVGPNQTTASPAVQTPPAPAPHPPTALPRSVHRPGTARAHAAAPPSPSVEMTPGLARADPSADASPATAMAPPAPPPTDPGAGAPWPVYPTRPPPAMTLHFVVQRGQAQGEATWEWASDGQHYTSHWRAEVVGKPVWETRSRGGFDAAGLAPDRMLEEQRERAVRAVNFQRDKGMVTYSGSGHQWALTPGLQDRASWLPQLLAIAAAHARPWAVGDVLTLGVAGPRGDLDDWRFTLKDAEPLLIEAAGPSPQAAQHWVREPSRPYDSRVDVWLASEAPHWPWAMQWQVVPGGEVIRWERRPDPLK